MAAPSSVTIILPGSINMHMHTSLQVFSLQYAYRYNTGMVPVARPGSEGAGQVSNNLKTIEYN